MKIPEHLFWIVFLANLAGAVWGFTYFYGDQFARTPLLLWPFVADCPLYALFFSGSMLLLKIFWKKRNTPLASFLNFFAFAGALKYGFWTVFVLLGFSSWYYNPLPLPSMMYFTLLFSHVGMFLEALLALPGLLKTHWWFVPATLAFLLANDFSDYLFGTHPPLPAESLGFMFPATVAMSLFFVPLSYFFLKAKSKPILPLLVQR